MYKYAYKYLECIGGVLIVMCPCMLLVAYCVVFHWTNVGTILMYVYYLFMQI